MVKISKKEKTHEIKNIFGFLHNQIQALNNSKIFAGLMIITLNIVSKFVNIKLSKTMESYLKYTFSKQILVFAIAWMGTRDIYIALFITIVFVICMEYLFHEDSQFYILPESFRDHHLTLLENDKNGENITDEDIKKAKEILEKANIQNTNKNYEGFSIK
jgi:hypothetical protein